MGSTLNKRFAATLQKEPGKGGWIYVMWTVEFFKTRGAREGPRHDRWPSLPEFVHGPG
jgi:hypothetical protein